MKIDFLGLQAFVSIAERGSFLAAAQHLNLSATAVSHRIRKLEDELAVDLLLRSGRSVTLTSAGAELLPKARRSIDDLAVSLEEIRKDLCQRRMFLAFGCLPALASRFLPSLLKKVKQEYPDLYVRVYDRSASEIADMVESSEVEFGLTIDFGLPPDLRAEAFAREDFFLVCRKDHPLAGKAEISWDDLSDQPLVRISEQTGNRRLIDSAIGLRRETLRWEYEVQRAATAMSIVQAGLAAALLPYVRSDIDSSSDVSYVALHSPSISRTLSIVTRRDTTLSSTALLFRNTILDSFRRVRPLK